MTTAKILSIPEMKFLKRVNIVASNRYGNDTIIGFFLYERPITKTYTFQETEKKNTLGLISERKQEEYPNDMLDEIIIQAVRLQYPKSFSHTTFVFSSSDVDHINRLKNYQYENVEFNIRPDFSGQVLEQLAGQSFNVFRRSIKVYTPTSKELIENIGFFGDCDFNRHNEIFKALDEINFM